ncbi:hypothetical protein RQY88_002204 [Vibrio vulnificus]|uniref:hypothetical protein n=1 Tax=Vibrio vulnificus TaxID=672 RepID=UPI002895076F|nr:hypothetical protein [Vibrio vulnificus]ELH9600839.1 hypothetical protein [Vibrio vulnificus]ELH9615297.1 hypothetical protein [Vibrio vulnificus]
MSNNRKTFKKRLTIANQMSSISFQGRIAKEPEHTFSELADKYEYIGWIPCVVGRLDFSKVGTDQLKYKKDEPICLSYMDEHSSPSAEYRCRYNAISSVYNWKDREDKNNDYSGEFRFLTILKTLPNGDAIGNAYLWSTEEEKKCDLLKKQVLDPLRELEVKVSHYQKALTVDQYNPSEKLDSSIVDAEIINTIDSIGELNKTKLKNKILVIKFHISSNGLTLLECEKRAGVDDSDNQELRSKALHSRFIAAKQAFIYLKYTLHTHKHHPAQEDRLTSVHFIDSTNLKNVAFRLIEDLRRSAIEIKVTAIGNEPSAEHLLHGFISYTKSLIIALEEKSLIDEKIASTKKLFFENMLGSWESIIQKNKEAKEKIKEIKAKQTKANDDALQALSILLATISVFFVGIKFTLTSVDTCSNSITNWALKSTCSIVSNKEMVLTAFIVILFSMLLVVTIRVTSNPYGLIRRFFKCIINLCNKSNAILLLRVVLFSLFFFSMFVFFETNMPN